MQFIFQSLKGVEAHFPKLIIGAFSENRPSFFDEHTTTRYKRKDRLILRVKRGINGDFPVKVIIFRISFGREPLMRHVQQVLFSPPE